MALMPDAARMSRSKPPRGAACVAWLGLVLGACAPDASTLVVGSKNFSEQDLLGEITARWIERTLDVRVTRKLHLGATFIAHRALVAGDIDLYPEYTGTAYTAVLRMPPVSDPDSVFRAVRGEYERRWGLTWLAPLGFENTFAMLVRASTTDSLGIDRLSQLAPHAHRMRAGFGYEFMQREDGFEGLRRLYGLAFDGPPREMDLGLVYRALASGEIDLTAGNSTDGRIQALGLRTLADDRDFFPPYEAALVVRNDALARVPGLRATLERLSGRIDTETMRALNRAVDLDGRPIAEVAAEWVDSELAGAAP